MFCRILRVCLVFLLGCVLLVSSSLPPSNQTERIRSFTRAIEFDYVSWTIQALGVKLGQAALSADRYIPQPSQSQLVLDYLSLIREIKVIEANIERIYADPATPNPEAASSELVKEHETLEQKRSKLEPLAETILQSQISETAARLHLTLTGQPVPPVLYRTTPPPDALIISPRNIIRADADISISTDLSIDQITRLEGAIDEKFNVSSLVVGIGGIGLYPTMVMETNDINWLAEVVAHEWVHNFLTLKPLGFNYLSSPELRIMNETAASIAGKEIGNALIRQYYPEYLPAPQAPAAEQGTEPQPPSSQPPAFNFNTEMHATRVTTDALLAEGKIEEAEQYMEARRAFFWENGYAIRKLNQAYFAFYGAYADEAVGAAGEDPVGAAMRALRAESRDLASFLNRIAWMWSYDQLQKAAKQANQ